jgi:hypothetical protein
MPVRRSRPGLPSALLGPARLESCASTLPNAVDSGGAESRDSGRDLDEEAEEEVGWTGVEPGDGHQSSEVGEPVELLTLLVAQWRSAGRSHVTRES